MEFNGTFFATIITFIVFVLIMNKMLYAPVRKIVNERNAFIEGNYNCAEKNNNKAAEISAKREEKLIQAKEDAREKYNELLSDFKEQRSDIVKNAQNESQVEINSACENLNNVSNETKEGLKGHMTDLANDIVEKVLGYRSEVKEFDNDTINDILYH